MGLTLQKAKQPVVANVEVVKNKSKVKSEQKQVATAEVSGPVANVGFSAAYTHNLGNYENLKVTVSLYLPVPINPAAVDEAVLDAAFDRVQAWVDKKMNKTVEEYTE
jgi:hypothetical protein